MAMATELGYGRYRAIVRESLSGVLVDDVTDLMTSGSWFNALNGAGSASVVLDGVSRRCGNISLMRGGVHELGVIRNDKELFCGPLTGRPIDTDSGCTISATTMDAWLGLRFARAPLPAGAGLKASEFIRLMVESGLSVNDPRLMAYVHYLTNDAVVTNEEIVTTKYPHVTDVLRPLVGSLTDYSTHGRRITFFPYGNSIGYLGSLTDVHMIGRYSTDRPLAGFATRAAVKTGVGRDETYTVVEEANPWGILIERRFEAASNAEDFGASKVSGDVPVKTSIGVDSPVTLSPKSPWRGESIEPGMTFTVNSTRSCDRFATPMRITRVGASWSASGKPYGPAPEAFQVGLEEWRGSVISTI